MSHFSVLVLANNEKQLEELLLPYHEYEFTGIKEYTEFVPADMDELRVDFEKHGNGRDLDTFADEWAGYERNADGVYGKITNPNAKWDWWQIGGRWTGLLSSYKPEDDPGNYRVCPLCEGTGDRLGWVYYEPDPDNAGGRLRLFKNEWAEEMNGCNGCRGKGVELVWPTRFKEHDGDAIPAREVNWEGIMQERLEKALQRWERYQNAKAEAIEAMRQGEISDEIIDRAKSRKEKPGGERWSLDELVEYNLIFDTLRKEHDWSLWGSDSDKYEMTHEEFVATQKIRALTYAFIDLNGGWNQRGEMGWWGLDDKSQGTPDYDKAFWEFVKTIPDQKIVYVIDCHI